jgi:hypothetical protein
LTAQVPYFSSPSADEPPPFSTYFELWAAFGPCEMHPKCLQLIANISPPQCFRQISQNIAITSWVPYRVKRRVFLL